MHNEIITIQNSAKFGVELGMNMDIQAFLKSAIYIRNYEIEIKDSAYIINIKLYEFSIKIAKDSFDEFMRFIRYKYYNLYLTEEESCAYRVKYYTLNEEHCGAYFEINFC